MSEQSKKQPKPFLKKGARQWSWTVRPQGYKPKIVDYSEDNNNGDTASNTITFGRQQQEQIKVTLKKSTFKDPEIKVSNPPKAKESRQTFAQKTKNTVNSSKKKSTGLEDYIGVSSQKKVERRESVQKQKSTSVSHKKPPFTMASQLSKQQLCQEDEEQDYFQSKQQEKPLKKYNYQPRPPVSFSKNEQEEPKHQVQFNSDSDEELPKNNIKFQNAKQKVGYLKQNNLAQRNRWNEDPQQQDDRQEEMESKVFQKFYQKDTPKKPLQKSQTQKPKLTIQSIPKQLKQQIINHHVEEKKSEIQKKLTQLQQIEIKKKQEKEKYQELNKQLIKERAEIQKREDNFEKEKEKKFKEQEDRIRREKVYLKEHQVNAKGDRVLKNQIEELRLKVSKLQTQKKQIKAKGDNQALRLQNKVNDLARQNAQLKNIIKFHQKQKIQEKNKVKVVEKKIQPKPVNYWEGAPTYSYVYTMAEPTFCLFDLDLRFFNYQQLEHFQFYMRKKDEQVPLQREDNSSEQKIVRKYKNGKEEVEYIGRVLKEKFPPPLQLTVVTHINDDLKLILPQGIQVYYDNRSQITQFKITTEKTIYNFHKLGQVEMKFRHPQLGEVHQLRKGSLMIRNSKKGQEKFKLLQNGDYQQIN